MTRPVKEILRDAIELPEPERLRVVERLLVSLDAKPERDIDAAWAEEVEARSRAIKRGVVRPISWAKVRSRARRRASAPR